MPSDFSTSGKMLNITQDNVVEIIRRIIRVEGLESAHTTFNMLNKCFSSQKGWAETADEVYDLLADIREEEQQRLREERLEERRAGAPNVVVMCQSSSGAQNIGKAEIDKMDVDVKSPGNNIARIINIGKEDNDN